MICKLLTRRVCRRHRKQMPQEARIEAVVENVVGVVVVVAGI